MKLGELLVEQGKISERDVERTLLAQAEMGDLFGQVLVKLGLVSEQSPPHSAISWEYHCSWPPITPRNLWNWKGLPRSSW